MNKIQKIVLLLLACSLPLQMGAEVKKQVLPEDCQYRGFNALNHLLQKPQGNPSFPKGNRSFYDHMFFGTSAGASMLGSELSGRIKYGMRVGGHVGGWITPMHGVRLSVDFGRHSVHTDVDRPAFGALRAEYLINFTSMLRGYSPSRNFELIGSVGGEYQRVQQYGRWGNAGGITASMQTRFNIGPSLFLFVEPRLSVITGRRYDADYDWRRMKADVSFNLGLGYRVLRGEMRAMESTPFSQIKDDNLFFGVEGGLWDFTRHDFPERMLREHNNVFGSAFAGKMLSSMSGVQAVMNFGRYVTDHKSHMVGIGSIDYVLDLGNACGGYRPRQVVQVLLNLGVSGAYINKQNFKIIPGVDAGIMGMVNLSPNLGLFVHPQVHMFPSKYAATLGRIGSTFASVGVGLRYTVGDFSSLFPESYADYNVDKRHWFLNFAGGAGMRLRGDYGPGMTFNVGFGKRFTPVSSWRISAEGSIFTKPPYYITTSLHADYLASITTSMFGYNNNRVFDLQLVLGVFGGAANYAKTIEPTFGLKGGLQAAFRLNKALDLIVEPQFLASYGPSTSDASHWTPDVRALLGMRYRLGTPLDGRGYIEDTPYGRHRNFAGISAGPAMFSGSAYQKYVSYDVDFHIGRWLSMVSGLRLTYANDWANYEAKSRYVGSLHLNYLLNFSSLFDRSAARRFHVIGALGGGIAFCRESETSAAPMAYGGVQFRYNLPANIDIHIEPGINLWSEKVLPKPYDGTLNAHSFTLSGALNVGLSYRF